MKDLSFRFQQRIRQKGGHQQAITPQFVITIVPAATHLYIKPLYQIDATKLRAVWLFE